MIKCLSKRINIDLENEIIAKWHDESHLNRYIYDYNKERYRILSPAYLYPEGWNIPFEEIITVRDKNKLGGHQYLRGHDGRYKQDNFSTSSKAKSKMWGRSVKQLLQR